MFTLSYCVHTLYRYPSESSFHDSSTKAKIYYDSSTRQVSVDACHTPHNKDYHHTEYNHIWELPLSELIVQSNTVPTSTQSKAAEELAQMRPLQGCCRRSSQQFEQLADKSRYYELQNNSPTDFSKDGSCSFT